MRKIALLVGLMVLTALPAVAQWETPRAEIFAGYSYLSADVGGGARVNAPAGFQGQIGVNFNDSVGFVADFGGHFKSGATLYEYLGGIRFTSRGDTATSFFHAMGGGATISNGGSLSGLALAFGGGVDVNMGESVAIRVVQFDYVLARFAGVWTTSTIRLGVGIVFKTGEVF